MPSKEDVFSARCQWDFPLPSDVQYKNMNLGSCYASSPLNLRFRDLALRYFGFAHRGPALASSRWLERNAYPLRGELSRDGLARSAALPPLPTPAGTMA
jgi:hypothetical protein